MTLSNNLFNNVARKLEFDNFLLEEKSYYNNLSEIIELLSTFKVKVKEDNDANSEEEFSYRLLYNHYKIKHGSTYFISKQDFVIMYIVTISFLKANIMIHVSDIKGNVKWFCSSGLVNASGKRRTQKRSIILKLLYLLFQKVTFLSKAPIALHLNNASYFKTFIINKLKKKFYIKIIKSFNQIPYNGCRKKKIRRKKFTKIFK